MKQSNEANFREPETRLLFKIFLRFISCFRGRSSDQIRVSGEEAGARAPPLPTKGATSGGVKVTAQTSFWSVALVGPRLGTEARHPRALSAKSRTVTEILLQHKRKN